MSSVWRRLRAGARVLLRRRAADEELDAEVRHYIDERAAELHAAGASPAEARRLATLELGTPILVREDVRTAGWEHALATLLTDVRYALRRLRHNLGFTAVTVLTLALGIGASTAIFSAVSPILLEPLPYPDARELVTIRDRAPDGLAFDVTFGTYRELLARTRTVERMAAMRAWEPTLTRVDEPERLQGQRVSADYFRVLGVAPLLGQDFDAEHDRVNGPAVVVLSHRVWQRRFDGDEAVIGRAITLSDRQYMVIGVMPASFENVLAPSADVWAPLQYDTSLPIDGREWGHHLRLVARVRGGVALDRAGEELNAIAAAPLAEFPRVPWASLDRGMTVEPLRATVAGGVRPALFALAGAVLLLLAIAAVNVTSLLLAQGARRGGELALRSSLGASRRRLIAQHVIETMVLAGLGAAAGIVLAYAGVRSLLALSPPWMPRIDAIRLDAAALLFALGLTAALGLLIGVIAALHWTQHSFQAGVQQHSVRVARRDSATRRILVVAEVALAVVLLVSGGLLMRSLQRLLAVDAGFDPAHVVAMRLYASAASFDSRAAVQQFGTQVLDAVRAVPGVTTAALTNQLPLTGDYVKYGFAFESVLVIDPNADGSAVRYAVTPQYFETLRIPLRSGRLLNERDGAVAPGAVVLGESLARRMFAGTDPIGQRVRIGGDDQPWSHVVGVVADVKHVSLDAPDENAVYVARAQDFIGDRTLWLVVRERTNAAALAPAIRNAIWSVQRDQPISDVATMDELVARSAAERRFILMIFETFALTALLLAGVGLYGLLAGGVHERLREIGVRSALGATRTQIVTLVLRQAMVLTVMGALIGFMGALGVTQALVSMLFGTSTTDAVTYIGAALLLIAAATAAASLPAWRAGRVDPAITLRAQ